MISSKSSEKLLDSLIDDPNQELNIQIAGTNTDSDSDESELITPKRQAPKSNLISPLLSTLSSLLQPRSSTFPQLSQPI